jgi:hypothetical protein
MLERRRLLTMLMAGSAGLAIPRRDLRASPDGREEEWLEAISARLHRAFLDIRSFAPDGTPFNKAANLHRALTEAHGARPDEVGIAFGAGSSSIGYVLGGDIWEEYRVGAKLAGTARNETEAQSLRDEPRTWAAAHLKEIGAMRAKEIRVLACRNSLWRWARDFAAVTGEKPDVVNEKLLSGLHPGVEPVPAMIAAAVRAQERGLSYVAIG